MIRPSNHRDVRVWLVAAVVLAVVSSVLPTRAAGRDRSAKAQSSGWTDDFSERTLNSSFWVVSNGQAPGYLACQHIGYFEPSNVTLSGGYLILALNQQDGLVDGCNGVVSYGAQIYTKKTYGYGTYQWTMRMSSTATTFDGAGYPVSGSISAGFLYVNNSQTEIDFEFPGESTDLLYMVNWQTVNHETFNTVSGLDVAGTFHTYKFIWQPGRIDYYVDGNLEATHTTNVPSAPAHFMINHWGTNNASGWGGLATVNTPRYFYIDSVSFTPLN
jgi:endo-1,3-1,4-beta-glycanase ExoK